MPRLYIALFALAVIVLTGCSSAPTSPVSDYPDFQMQDGVVIATAEDISKADSIWREKHAKDLPHTRTGFGMKYRGKEAMVTGTVHSIHNDPGNFYLQLASHPGGIGLHSGFWCSVHLKDGKNSNLAKIKPGDHVTAIGEVYYMNVGPAFVQASLTD